MDFISHQVLLKLDTVLFLNMNELKIQLQLKAGKLLLRT